MKKSIMYVLTSIVLFLCFNISAKALDTNITYQTHIENIGWQNYVSTGEVSGTFGQGLRLESIRILLNSDFSGGISYQTHVQNIGWQENVSNNELSGTTGQGLRLEAIKINLTGEIANHYDIYYQVHAQNYGWLGWSKNGEEAGTAGYGYRLEAIKIVLVEKGVVSPGETTNSYIEKEPSVTYQTHIQNVGWQDYVSDGQLSGTTGQGLRLESLKVYLSTNTKGGGITYQTHIQNIGWQNYVSNNELSGTTGLSYRMEAIKLKLYGEIANYYDIYYRVHVENVGWLDWAMNDEAAGSEGYGYRMESIQIQLVKKGGTAPGTTSTPFIYKTNFVWTGNPNNRTLYNTGSGIISTNARKIIDVSEHQGTIDWDRVIRENNIDGVILRAGYGGFYEDDKFSYNVAALKRLNIPYGIYIFSYAENDLEATSEATGILNMITKYELNPILGVYYDIEDWELGYANSYGITKETYESMSNIFLTSIRNVGYTAGIYSGLNFANNRLNANTKLNLTWIAQYNSTCQYTGIYKMWQFSSNETVSGIKGRVDMNVWFN